MSLAVRAHGETHVGKVREANEDAVIVDPELGLYAVLDGMGGAMAGDVAAQRARDTLHAYVAEHRESQEPGALLEAALQAASAAVHAEAHARRDRKGMGTTAVACLVVAGGEGDGGGQRAVIAHVGDSRAYLLRERRLSALTRDHTVVAELLAQGAITAQEAETHLYKNVLSRNLGARSDTKADLNEVVLQPGDRLLLCSDGLHGFASHEALQYLVGSNEPPDQVARDLIEAALRGGGGDNVTAVVIEAGAPELPRTTQILRSSGALGWWARRDVFLATARQLGVPASPICSVLSPDEAIDIVAGNLCEAVFHDLEKSTGVNVWTYAENLAHGWLDQGGNFPDLAALLDKLGAAARASIDDLRRADATLGALVDAGVTRALQVADMAIGGVLAERLRAVEAELVRVHAAREAKRASLAPRPFIDTPTIPFMRTTRLEAAEPEPEVKAGLEAARIQTRGALLSQPLVPVVIDALCGLASGDATTADVAARTVWGARTVEEKAVAALFDAIDQARSALAGAIAASDPAPSVVLGCLRRLAAAQAELAIAVAHLAIETASPRGGRLDELTRDTASLRTEVARNEARIAGIERSFDSRDAARHREAP